MSLQKGLNKNILLVFLGFILILTIGSVPFSTGTFMLTSIFIISSKKCNPKYLIVYMGSYLILLNITFVLPISNDDYLLSLYLLLSIIVYGKYVGDFDIGKKRSTIVFLTLLVVSAANALTKYFEKMTELLMNLLLNLGYDQVGHFAITRTLGECREFLFSCDPNSLSLPLNYMFYPQQWHLFFSRFINNESLLHAIQTYLVVLVVSSVLSFYFISQSIKHFTLTIEKVRLKQYPHLKPLKKFMQVLVYLQLTYLILLGYPNFVFALALFVFAVTLHDNTSSASYFLLSLCLIGSISMYTLFLVPGVLVFLYRTISSQARLSIKVVSMIVWLMFIFSIYMIAIEKNHVDFIDIGGGGINIVVVTIQIILFVGLVLNVLQVKNKEICSDSSDYELFIVNAILLGCLLGLNALLFYTGDLSGYYLLKFAYFAIILGTINLFVTVSKINMTIPYILMKPTSILLILALVWYPMTLNPYTSTLSSTFTNLAKTPFVTLVNITSGPSTNQRERILNIYSAAQFSKLSSKPVVVLTNNSGPDTQWANSLSGNWSAELNEYLENEIDNEIEFRDPDFQAQHKNTFVFYESEKG